MAAPILWVPGIFRSLCWKAPRAHKIPRFRGVCFFLGGGQGGGWKCQFYFMGVGIFQNQGKSHKSSLISKEKVNKDALRFYHLRFLLLCGALILVGLTNHMPSKTRGLEHHASECKHKPKANASGLGTCWHLRTVYVM